jgi:hypothetical protein
MKPECYKVYGWYIKVTGKKKGKFFGLFVSNYSIQVLSVGEDWFDGTEKEISKEVFVKALEKVHNKILKEVAK